MLILGIELGSTRIKSVLIDEKGSVLTTGSHVWQNRLEEGYWTYHLDEIWTGIRTSYSDLDKNYFGLFGEHITKIDTMGISGMMHGYLAFDREDRLLVPFRTWRNATTAHAAHELSEIFQFNMPQRWSTAHFYQAVLDGEPHVKDVSFLTTLAGYVHWQLTGKKVLGIGDASGMFPVKGHHYDEKMLDQFDRLLAQHGLERHFEHMLPGILCAGENAGSLSPEGAKLLDPEGYLQPGVLMCPPEGDAGTGMVATNSVAPSTGNVSAGTSVFLMVVLEKMLSRPYEQIDIVSTPDGFPVAMVHCNNCTSALNNWVRLFCEFSETMGAKQEMGEVMNRLFSLSLSADDDTGGIVAGSFVSAEPILGLDRGQPFLGWTSGKEMNLANFMQAQVFSCIAALRPGVDILYSENVKISSVCGHGGFFKTPIVGQQAMSAVLKTSVTLYENAGEGGAWGIALLALYASKPDTGLSDFLNTVFSKAKRTSLCADEKMNRSFNHYYQTLIDSLK